MSRKDLVLTLHSLLTVPVGTTVAFALMSE